MFPGRYTALIFLLILTHSLYAQTDNIGSGRAITFDGVDDYIDFGDIYSDLKLPFTISGWVYLDPSNTQPAPIFTNRNCDPIYTGFRLIVNNNAISMDYGDGLGGNSPAFRRGKLASVDLLTGNWNHITAVVRDVSDMDLYLNGVNVGGTYGGSSSQKMDSSKPGFASTAYFISNGVIYRFKGSIDDIRLWNRALTETEIRNTMCVNLVGNESGLIGYWTFNETSGTTVLDRSPNHFNGTFVGQPVRVFSGAPIGDISTNLYSNNFAGQVVSLTHSGYTINVKTISNTSLGAHVYAVDHSPSQTGGLPLNTFSAPYFGVFLAKQDATASFNSDLSNSGNGCQLYSRNNNSVASWLNNNNPVTNFQKRAELIRSFGVSMPSFDLGQDRIVCDEQSFNLSTGINDPQFYFHWNDNETTSSIVVSASGKYIVTVTGPCSAIKDSVNIQFATAPSPFSLGSDSETCLPPATTLHLPESPSYSYTWQDGTTKSTLQIQQFGTFYATIKNVCGQVSDTITFSKKSVFNGIIPNVITPNDDEKNDYFLIPEDLLGSASLRILNRWGKEVFFSEKYDNRWGGEGVSEGVYYALITSPCLGTQRHVLNILH